MSGVLFKSKGGEIVFADVLVIGAGAVGCAVSRAIKRAFPGKQVAVLERREEACMEASRYNSGVVHSGIHQNPDFLKSKLAQRGSKLMAAFCAEEGVPCRKTGMIIAAANRDVFGLSGELRSLLSLSQNSRRQGITLRILSPWSIRRIEPAVRALFGIYIPDIWLVDQRSFGAAISAAAKRDGVNFFFRSWVHTISFLGDCCHVETPSKSFVARLVVNAAGIHADTIARLAGFKRYSIFPYRGEYYEVIGSKRDLLRSTPVYPALPPGHPVKGIHLTKTLDGRLLIGPNASPWHSRADDFGVHTPPREFLEAAQRFLPGLEISDLKWAYSGLRAKVNDSTHEDDFVIRCDSENPGFINLVGIESPGLTASLAIAEYLEAMVQEKQLL